MRGVRQWISTAWRWFKQDMRIMFADVKGAFFYDETAYVVIACEKDNPHVAPWHVIHGGVAFGMDYETGTFVGNRRGASQFAAYRNDRADTDPGYWYYYVATLSDLK